MIKKYLSVFLVAIPIGVFAQQIDTSLVNYNWDENRKPYEISAEEAQIPSIALLEKTAYECVFEGENIVMYSLVHEIVRVNSDDAIEQWNTISISMYNTINVVNIKARTILPDGRKIELNKDNIKEIKNDQENNASKIFAIEGVEKGSEIEYFYVKKMNFRIYGSCMFQASYPIKQSFYTLSIPSHLAYKFKGYNGLPKVEETIIGDRHIYYLQINNIPELRQEEFANYTRERMRLEYKFAYNVAKNNKELYTWSDIVQQEYTILHNLESKELSAVNKLYKKLKINQSDTDDEKISKIENYIKSNIIIQEVYQDEKLTLDKVIHNKFGGKDDLTKLYTALFHLASIDYQLVYTSKRDELPFDGSFESWRFLNNYIFYFPTTNKYLTPEEMNYRYPMIPYNLTFTEGLFMKNVSVAGLETAVASVKFIPPLDAQSTANHIDVDVSFTPTLEMAHIRATQSLKGYYAVYVQPYYSQLTVDKQQQLLEDLMKGITKDTQYTKLWAENTDPNTNLIDTPFVVHAELDGNALIEQAGNRMLFKVGELIGPQMELYQDKQRKLKIENDYNREYIRTLKITIPDGYVINNLNDINIKHVYEKDGKMIFNFISSYTLNGNLLTINVNETYREISCPLDKYENYRSVINGAADFNKVVLVFEPKN
jgi:hypothetical protein